MSSCIDHRSLVLASFQFSKPRGKAVRNATRALLENLESRRLLTVSLDTSFGGDGLIDTISYSAVAALPDDKILLGKMGSTNAFTLYRYNANGTLDNSYGSGGTLQ